MKKRIRTLQDHTEPFVTTSELAEYWMVSRSQIYKHIDAGTLRAIRLGPRLLRISLQEALDFERRAKLDPGHGRGDGRGNGSVNPS
jgi:excisionase family DNA binding protein